jgi:hypothetical protein
MSEKCPYGGEACEKAKIPKVNGTSTEKDSRGCVLADMLRHEEKKGTVTRKQTPLTSRYIDLTDLSPFKKPGKYSPLEPQLMLRLIDRTLGYNIKPLCKNQIALQATIDRIISNSVFSTIVIDKKDEPDSTQSNSK